MFLIKFSFKRFILFQFLLLLNGLAIAQENISKEVVYVNPVNGSFNNDIKTNILVKFKQSVDLSSIKQNANLVLFCNGIKLNFNLIPLNENKTIILKPKSYLPENSKIEIQFNGNISYTNSVILLPFTFSFYTAKSLSNQAIKAADNFLEISKTNSVLTNKTNSLDSNKTVSKLIKNQLPISVLKNDNSGSGNYFVSTLAAGYPIQNRLMILDKKGKIIYEKLKPNSSGLDFKKLSDSLYSYFDPQTLVYVILDYYFNEIDVVMAGNGYFTDNHEIQYNKKTGNYTILAYHYVRVNMADSVNGGNSNATVMGLIVQEIDKDDNVVFEWKTLDHLPILDSKGVDLTADIIDYVHCNAIDIDTDSTILLSSRHLNEIEKINKNTGELVWRFGLNANHNNFTFLNDSIGFSYQHDIRKLANGNYTLFDNGNLRKGVNKYSRAVEYKLDENFMTAILVSQFRNSPDLYSPFMGNVQTLPNGNKIIGWGGNTTATLTEINQDNEIVFEANIPGAYSYRAYSFDVSTIIAMNENINKIPSLKFCNVDSVFVKSELASILFPNINNETIYELNVENDTAYAFTKTKNGFFDTGKTSLSFNFSKLKQKDTLICKGVGKELSIAEYCNNASYKWSTYDLSSAIIIRPDTTTTYWVDITNGNFTRRDSIKVSVSEVPNYNILGSKIFSKPFAVETFSVTLEPNYKYFWKIDNGNIVSKPNENAIQIQFDSTKPTFIQSIISNEFGCKNSSSIVVNYDNEKTNLRNVDLNSFKFYPNPSNGLLNIEYADFFNYKILDLTGKEVLSSHTDLKSFVQLDLSDLIAGFYIIALKSEKEFVQYKLQKL